MEGLAAHLLDLTVDEGGVTLLASETLAIDGVLAPRGVARLLLPGERVTLSEQVEICLIPSPPAVARVGTMAVARQLLGQAGDPDASHAACFTCLTGLDMGRRFYVGEDKSVIGRGTAAILRLRDRAVSRQHARLRKGRGTYYIEDVGAPNGVFVNGARLRTLRILNDGDIVEVGRSLLRYRGPVPDPAPDPESVTGPASKPGAPSLERTAIAERHPVLRDWALVGVGLALTLAGLLVTWGMSS